MKKIIKWFLWLWTPEYPPEETPEPVSMDDLTRIREQKKGLKETLKDLDKTEKEIESRLMAERSEILMEKLTVFTDEIRSGQALWDFREVKRAIDLLKATGPDFMNYFGKRDDLLGNDRSRRAFWVNFVDKMAKPNSDFGIALEFIAARRKPSNPCTKGGIF